MEKSTHSLGFRLVCVLILGVFSFSELTFSAGNELVYLSFVPTPSLTNNLTNEPGYDSLKGLLKQIKEELVNFFFPSCYAQEGQTINCSFPQKTLLPAYHPSLSWTKPQEYLTPSSLSSSLKESQVSLSQLQPKEQTITNYLTIEQPDKTVFPASPVRCLLSNGANDTVMIRLFNTQIDTDKKIQINTDFSLAPKEDTTLVRIWREELSPNPTLPLTALPGNLPEKQPLHLSPANLLPAIFEPKMFLPCSRINLNPDLCQKQANPAYSIDEPIPILEPYKLPLCHAPPSNSYPINLTSGQTRDGLTPNCAFSVLCLLLPSVNPLSLIEDISSYTNSDNQTSFLGLKEISAKYGLTLYPRKVSPSQLSQFPSSSTIIHLQLQDNLGHYILLKQILNITDNLVAYYEDDGTINTGSFLGYILTPLNTETPLTGLTSQEPQTYPPSSGLTEDELTPLKGGLSIGSFWKTALTWTAGLIKQISNLIKKDKTPPSGSIQLNLNNNNQSYTNCRKVTLTLQARDSSSGVDKMQFSTDQKNWSTPEPYSTSKTINLPSGDGKKTIYVRFSDKAGNWSKVYSLTITLDTSSPQTTLSGLDELWHNTPLTLTLTADDKTSGINQTFYSTDGSFPTIPYAQPITISGEGTWTILYYSQDKAGNSEGVKTARYEVKIDTTSPSGTVTLNNTSGYISSNALILNLSADDFGSGLDKMQFSTDQKNWSTPEPYSTSKTINLPSGDGKKTIYVRFSDKAGNWSEAYSLTVTLDTTSPTQPEVIIEGLNPTHKILFSFQSADISSGIAGYSYCLSTDEQGDQLILPWTSTPQTSIELNDLNLTEGIYYILVKAKDFSGNESKVGLSEPMRVYPPVTTQPITSRLQAQLDEESLKEPVSASAGNPAISQSATVLNNLSIDPLTGSSNLSIPLEVPPGRQGIQPNLSLVYSSSIGNTGLGLGWSLSGLGAIERSTKKDLPGYDNSQDTFIFSLSGISGELVNIGNNEYRAKEESLFLKFVFNPEANLWEVTDKSGTKYILGLSSNSRQEFDNLGTFSWQIEKIIDLSGNYIHFTYQKDQAQLYPNQIEYTANQITQEPGFAEVHFILEDRPDPATSYRTGRAITTAKRLFAIETYFQDKLVRQFKFGYTQQPDTLQSLLFSLTEYGSDQITSFTPYIFTYTQNSLSPSPSPDPNSSSSITQGISLTKQFSNNSFSPLTADFNADTKTDIGVIDQQGNFLIALSEGEDFLTPATYLTGYRPSNNSRLSLGDFNGDTKTDIALVPSGTADWTSISGGNHAGADWTLTQQEVIAGLHTGIDRFIIPQGITAYVAGWLEIQAATIEISGILCADGTGYAGGSGCKSGNQPGSPGTGPGKGNSAGTYSGGGGGAYGAKGGDNIHWGRIDAGGGSGYGNVSDWEIQPGSGGGGGGGDTGNGGVGGNGGNGGGCIKLLGSAINISGTVSANGLRGENGQHRAGGGGGSGGGILIFGNDLTITGILQAKGGDGGGSGDGGGQSSGAGAGSGGRLKVFWHNSLEGTINHQENGGLGGDGPAGRGGNGENGSFYSAQTEQTVTDELNLKVILSQGDSFAQPGCWLEQDRLPADISSVLNGDFNADGLTDLCFLSSSNGTYAYYVSISEGTRFLAPEIWLSNAPFANTTNCQTLSADFNADGLTDLACFNKDTGICQISLSEGRRFITPYSFSLNLAAGKELSCYDINSDGRQDLGFLSDESKGEWQFVLSQGTGFNPSPLTYKTNLNSQQQLADFNGDSLPDSFSFDQSNGTYQLCLTPQPQERLPDLLLYEVQNGIGGSISIKYKPSNSSEEKGSQDYHLPFAFWTVEKVTLNDGLGNSTQTNYQYREPCFSYSNREFRGFAYSKVTDAEGNTVESYFLQDDAYKGRLDQQEIKDKEGNLYTKTRYTYRLKEIYPQVEFVYLEQTDAWTYDGDSSFKQTRTKYIYDDYGNVKQTTFEGDLTITGDEKTTVIEYNYNPETWLLSLPKHTYTQGIEGHQLAEKWFYYDDASSIDTLPTKGLLTKEEVWNYNPLTSLSSLLSTCYSYDEYGNPFSVTDSLGRVTTTRYDEQLHTYPKVTTNCLGHTLTEIYDPATGNLLTTTDPNGQTTSNSYDPLGRLIKVIGPQDTEELPSVIYEYAEPDKAELTSDPYTRLLLDFEEEDFTDQTGKQVFISGNPQIDKCGSLSGKASACFDGDGDYLTLADSDDWNLGKEDWTIDFWVKFNALSEAEGTNYFLLSQSSEGNMGFQFRYVVASGRKMLSFLVSTDGANWAFQLLSDDLRTLTTNTWYHLAVARQGDCFTMSKDGVVIDTKTIPGITIYNSTNTLNIGASNTPSDYLDGCLNNLRISKGIARWTSDFTPPQQDKKELFRLTKKVKQTSEGDYLTYHSFYDGLGRLIQTKSPADNDPTTNLPRQIVSGRIIFDTRGKVKEKFTSYFTTDVNDQFDTQDISNLPKFSFTYDPLGRLTKTTHPDGTSSSVLYSDWQITYLVGTGTVPNTGVTERGTVPNSEGTGTVPATALTGSSKGTVPNSEGTGTVPQKTTHFLDAYGRITKVEEYQQGTVPARATTEQGTVPATSFTASSKGTVPNDTETVPNPKVEQYNQAQVYTTIYEYDLSGNLTKLTDNQGNITQLFYDSLSRKLKMLDPDMGTWSYDYDMFGNLISQTDAKGQTLEFRYDELNRLGLKLAGSKVLAEYLYDDPTKENCIGRLSKVLDLSGSTEFFYDRLGREIRSIKSIAGTVPDDEGTGTVPATSFTGSSKGTVPNDKDCTTYPVQREYDCLDRLTKLIYPDETIIQYQYNPQGLEKVTDITNPLNPFDYIQNIAYSSSGHTLQIDYGNRTTTYYRYYPNSSKLFLIATLNPQESQTLQELYYQYDALGNITHIEDKINQTIQSFAYDDLNRLETAERTVLDPAAKGLFSEGGQSLKILNYSYDSIGNLLEKEGITYRYDGPGPHAPTQVGDATLSYDANGNLTTKQTSEGNTTVYTYDSENRLTEVQQEGIITSIIYDGDGGRVAKEVTSDQRTVTRTTYIGSLFEIATTDAAEENPQITQIKHIFAGSQRIATVTGTVPNTGVTERGTVPVTIFYHPDHLGSSSVITDQAGKPIQHCEYTPYGSIAKSEGSDSSVSEVSDSSVIARSEATPQSQSCISHLFTGKEQDASTNLYFYGARYYDPELGKFITPDTIVQAPYDPQSLNRYAYCRNNPINYVDPSGHSWKSFWKSLGNAFAGGAAGGIVTALLLPVIGPLAFAVGGAVAGATTSALNGAGWQGILIGAAIGAVLGGGLGGLAHAGYGVAAGIITGGLLLAGGIQSYQQGGWEGVGDYAGGVIGGITGFGVGYSVGTGISKAITSPSGNNPKQVKVKVRSALETDQKPEVKQLEYKTIQKSVLNRGDGLSDKVAETFSGGKYERTVLKEAKILYKVHGEDKEFSHWFTDEQVFSEIQARIDFAIKPEWGSTCSKISTYGIPEGTVVYVGEVSSQGGFYVGGKTQYYIEYVAKEWLMSTETLIK